MESLALAVSIIVVVGAIGSIASIALSFTESRFAHLLGMLFAGLGLAVGFLFMSQSAIGSRIIGFLMASCSVFAMFNTYRHWK